MIALSDLKEWLGVTVSTYDTMLTALEARAVAFVEKQTGRYFGAVEAIEWELRGDGSEKLWLPESPVKTDGTAAAVADLVVVYRGWPGDDETTLTHSDDDGFLLRSSQRGRFPRWWLHRKGGELWWCGYEYDVTTKRGYATSGEPGDIRQLVLDLCALKWNLRDKAGLESETVGGYSYTRSDFDENDLTAIVGALATIEAWRPGPFA